MFGLLKSVVDLTANVATVVTTPVKMVVDLADAVAKPLADVAQDLAKDVERLKD